MTANPLSNARRKVLILGANGRFGLAAAQAFTRAGWDVVAQVRRTPEAGMPAGVRCVFTPITDLDALCEDAAGAAVVVHALNPAYTRWHTDLLPMARLGMDIAERLGARFALPGNVYNFGAGMPARLVEGTPHHPTTRKGKLRDALEAELRRRAPKLRSLVLRGGDFFGAGSGNWFDLAMVKDVARGRLAYPGTRTLTHAWAYLPDMAAALAAVCAAPGLPDAADIHFPGFALTGDEMLDALEKAARALGLGTAQPFRRGGVPWGLMRAGAFVVPIWREVAEMRYLWETPHALESRAFAALAPGLRATPLDAALRASLRALVPGTTAAPALAA